MKTVLRAGCIQRWPGAEVSTVLVVVVRSYRIRIHLKKEDEYDRDRPNEARR
jgi:hypothetical protein